jgi:serine/threonine protein kinase
VLYQILAKDKDCKILRQLVRKMAQALDSIQNSNFVHSDIKPDNILVKLDKDHSKIEELKVIDFGSSFKFDDRMEVTATTPEYLPPEVIYYLEQIGKTPSAQPQAAVELRTASRGWSLDVWSLGVILLEIITGYPVWMAVKCKLMTATNKPKVGQGIFAVKDREPLRIIAAQKKFM